MTSKPAKKPAQKKTAQADVITETSKASEADWADAWVTALAPSEAFWRKHARPTSKQQFISEQANNGAELAKKLLAMLGQGDWPTLDDCIPKGSILDVVDKFFYEKTDLPREIPFYTVIQYVSSLLLQQGVQIQKSRTQVIYPDLWTIVLANSGGGKSLTLDAIANAMGGTLSMFPHADSYAKFFENLQANNKSFYLRDEFAKFIRAISKEKKMEGLQGCLLNVYSNAKVSYSTKSDSEFVEKPALTILGLTQIANITTTISKSMIDDGFAQRFGYAFAEKDDRPRVLDYVLDGLQEEVSPLWKQLTASPFHSVYHIDDVVSKTFSAGGNLIMDRGDANGMREDFSRRVVFRAFKYALVYHVLAGKTDQYLHAEDMAHGLRLCARELGDTSRLLDMFELLNPPSKTTKPATLSTATTGTATTAPSAPQAAVPILAISNLTKVMNKLQDRKATNAAPITIGKLQAGIRALHGSATETRALAAQAVADDATLAPFVKL